MNEKDAEIICPPKYFKNIISPAINSNGINKELAWTYIVAKKYEKHFADFVTILCDPKEELPVPDAPKIWLEAHLYPTRRRQEERKKWRSIADLAIGFLENVTDRKNQIRAADRKWICIAESKMREDISFHNEFLGVNQLSQMIEHAFLIHDRKGNFPDKVYFTLITPERFKDQSGKSYWRKFHAYKSDKSFLEKDLLSCDLPFLEKGVDMDKLISSRITGTILELNWVTFEKLLGLPNNLPEECFRSRLQATEKKWEQIFAGTGAEETFIELKAMTGIL